MLNKSMGKRVTEGEYSMPMMIYFASCHFSCPDIIFLELPRIPPNGFITCVLVNAIIAGIFGIINFQTCIRIMKQGLVAEIKEKIRQQTVRLTKVEQMHLLMIICSCWLNPHGMMECAILSSQWLLFFNSRHLGHGIL
jgi:hypothetical protein